MTKEEIVYYWGYTLFSPTFHKDKVCAICDQLFREGIVVDVESEDEDGLVKRHDVHLECTGQDYVKFGDIVAHGHLDGQTQYISRYIDGKIDGWPNLGEGLRFKGDPGNYHDVTIHKDDVDEFVRRVREHRGE